MRFSGRHRRFAMLSVAQAQALVMEQARPLPAVQTALNPECLGLTLAEDVASDVDMPPYDKALMDGFAVRRDDVADGSAILEVVGEVAAGATARMQVGSGQAVRIMTGAPIPSGADAVVMVERSLSEGERQVHIDENGIRPGQNILRRGTEMRQGDVVLRAGKVLRPQELGLLAIVGKTVIAAHPRPKVTVLSTGDELVEAPARPSASQIRNSNGPMLTAQVRRAGALACYLGIGRDTRESLVPLVQSGLDASVLVLSGGVSAGNRDLVPTVLQEVGVTGRFHKVQLKPGKPLFFGTRGGTLVFGLPGNPVSALVCFELFVRPALRVLLGDRNPIRAPVQAALAAEFSYQTDRPTYYPAILEETADGRTVQAVPWFGSPDLRGLGQANALMVLPAGATRMARGDKCATLALD
jgi:molybdopterin molybdotransferase